VLSVISVVNKGWSMFGLDFLFASALFALPVAGLPILLHMLFRRKSPTIYFPTLRFIKSSIQQTAARRRIQRWFLLACRVLLLALLVWAIAQPVRILAAGWFKSNQSVIAAVVADTSYSMQLRRQEMTLLEKSNDILTELLRDPLKDAKLAIFRSQPPLADQPETLQTAAKILSEWSGLQPQPAPQPLYNRITAAINFLDRQQANQKWLVILTDLQSREFPSPLPELKEGRVILFDLHPDAPRSAGIASVRMEPEQPIPGIGCTSAIEVTGQAGDARALSLNINKLDGSTLKQIGPLMASFDAAGRSRVRAALPEGLPVERWVMITANLQADDDLPWDNTRSHLVELPPRQTVTFVDAPAHPAASTFIRLALDPWEGKVPAWPLEVKRAADLTGQEQVAVIPLTDWPNPARATRLLNFVRSGGTLILLLQPGLEQTWADLAAAQKSTLLSLLPANLASALPGGGTAGSGLYRPVPPAKIDRVLEGLTDPSFRLDQLAVRRFVPFATPTDPTVSTLLHLSPAGGDSRTASFGLLYRRSIGAGAVYTIATLPESHYISPPTHPLFLPLLIGMALRPPELRDVQNTEIGQPLVLAGTRYAQHQTLEIQGPTGERYRVAPVNSRFTFTQTDHPGLYWWRTVADAKPVALAGVQLPAAESDLIYKPANALITPGPNALIVHSIPELQSTIARINEPQPQWTGPLVLVLILMCFEALLASMSHLWKPLSFRSLLPGALATVPGR
jgi:hypothetical protein